MSSLINSPFLSSKSFLNTIKYLKISFFILLVLGSVFKSLFLLGIVKENFVYKDNFENFVFRDLLIIAGNAGLAIIYIISSLNKKGVLIIAFNYLIALFLIGSLFFFSGYPGGKTMLYLSMGIIPLLILAISFGKKSENEITIDELLWLVAILFVLIFGLIARIIYLGSLISATH
jgi:hypothetical protein